LPDNDFTTEVSATLGAREIFERVICPDPTVVGKSKRSLGMFESSFITRETSEVRLDKR
jgi:hypothetical protein